MTRKALDEKAEIINLSSDSESNADAKDDSDVEIKNNSDIEMEVTRHDDPSSSVCSFFLCYYLR